MRRVTRHITALLLFLLLAGTTKAGEVAFKPGREIGWAEYTQVTDLNGDGKLDLIATAWQPNPGGGNHRIYALAWYDNLDDKPTTFTCHLINNWIFEWPYRAMPADLDGDGDIDLVVAGSYDQPLHWLENDGANPPQFTAHALTTSGNVPVDIAVADFDGDGKPDVVASFITNTDSYGLGTMDICWFENNGASPLQFTYHHIDSQVEARYLLPADVNGDEQVDLLISGRGRTRWMRNEGGRPPVFAPMQPVSNSYGHLGAADLNQDGRLDVVVGYSWCEQLADTPTSFTTRVYAPTFKPITENMGEGVVADLNHDGRPDLLAYDPSGAVNELDWFENLGGNPPVFAPHRIDGVANPLYHMFYGIAVGDLDGDGDQDVLCSQGGRLLLYENLQIWQNGVNGRLWSLYQ